MQPVPDERWKAVYEINSYGEYIEKLGAPIQLMDVVDKDVQEVFRLANKLIALGYYEYEFWDLACMKALLAFELALKKRYLQLNAEILPKRINLKDLIEWFRKRDYFETDSKYYLDQIRIIRNHFAHPDFHSFGGPMVSWHIPAAASLINDLYEDVELRQSRRQELSRLNEKLRKLEEGGLMLTIEDGYTMLVYRFVAGFINNKRPFKDYHFIYKHVFTLPAEFKKGDSVPVYNAYQISCNSYTMNDIGDLVGFDNNGKQVFKLELPLGFMRLQWNNWFVAYKKYIKELPYFSIPDDRSISEVIGEIKWAFHYK